MSSIFLSPVTWDLCADVNGNIAVAAEPYSLAQDAACACRTVAGEVWYDTTQGVPYYTNIMGHKFNATTLKSQLIAAAMTVVGVASAKVFLTGFSGRTVTGQVQVSDSNGTISSASF